MRQPSVRGTLLLVVVLLGPAISPALAEDPPEAQWYGPLHGDCAAMAASVKGTLKQWSQGGRRAVHDTEVFWNLVGPPGTMPFGRVLTLGEYIRQEDGLVPPIRTGREKALYEAIKTFAKNNPSGRLDYSRILRLSLDASADAQGRANVSVAMLTAHNVMRALARPLQWWDTFSSTDPMKDVFDDLKSRAPDSLSSIMEERGLTVAKAPGGLNAPWTELLFDRADGVFATAVGAKDRIWNGGCHYYFWLGALANHMGYTETSVGATWEMILKAYEGSGLQGVVQLGHYECGAQAADRVWRDRSEFRPGGPLTVTGVSAPGSVVNNAPRLDINVSWSGDAVPPLTVIIRPRTGWACEQGGCSTKIGTFQDLDNPATMPAAAYCYGYDYTWLLQWEVVIRDGDGASTENSPFPVSYTCIVP